MGMRGWVLSAIAFSLFLSIPSPLQGQVRSGRRRSGGRQAADKGRISRVEWSKDGKYLFYTNQGKRFKFDLGARKVSLMGKDEKAASRRRRPPFRRPRDRGRYRGIPRPGRGRQYSAEPSPDGKWIARCRDWNVVLEKVKTKETVRVTVGGNRKFRYGTANWVYGEELNVRHGMWWSPDSKKLVFYVFDERPVKDFYLTRNLTKVYTTLDVEGYMKAGTPNPVVSLAIYDLEKKKVTPVDTGKADQYLFRMRFAPGGKELLFNRTDRRQKRLDVIALDLETGKTRVVVTETQATWQKNDPLMRFLDDGKRFLWETEKTGWRQYELRRLDGSRVCTLTRGNYPSAGVVLVDEKKGLLFYSAYSDKNPLCLQLHMVRLDGKGQKRLTTLSYNHSSFNISPDRKWFTAQYEDVETPPSTALYSAKGELVYILAKGAGKEDGKTRRVELFKFKADDGVTDIYGVLYKPKGFDPKKKYPLIVNVYGGPESRAVRNFYRSRFPSGTDYLYARIDNRGTSGRGKAFMEAVYGKLGDVDIRDQADGVRYLRKRPYVDGSRVGIVGGSYGGYMAAMGVLKHPDVFRAAVVRSGVTDWRNYDTIYTERYMGLPRENPEGYRKGSCMTYVKQFKGKILIMHGMVDDNVHPNNAWQLIDALDRAGKKYESRFFPRAGHGTGGSDTQRDFFRRWLLDRKGT